MYLSKTKKSKCGYCSKEMLDNNLKQNCKEVHEKARLVKGKKTLTFSTTQGKPPPKVKTIMKKIWILATVLFNQKKTRIVKIL